MTGFSHVDPSGTPRMVDVSAKPVTRRTAWAEGYVLMNPETRRRLQQEGSPKGPILQTAKIAAVHAAKKTADLIPLCHPLPLDQVEVAFAWDPEGLRIESRVTAEARTGVEMEALTAVAVACLTVYDMCKAVDAGIRIHGIRLLQKTGGGSGRVEYGSPRLLPAE